MRCMHKTIQIIECARDILWRSKAARYFYNLGFERAVQIYAHPEPAYSSPRQAMTVCAKIGGGEHG